MREPIQFDDVPIVSNVRYWLRLQQFTRNLNERLVLQIADVKGGTIRGIICAATARHK